MRKNAVQRSIVNVLNALSSKKIIKYIVYFSALILFFLLILLPPIFGIAIKWNTIPAIFNQPEIMGQALNAIAASFTIALLVSALDLIAGIPMAWLISRGKSKWLKVLDTLADIPFIVPTAALGYSLLLFWYEPQGISSLFAGSLISPGWLLIMLLHFTFSYPVVVRVLVGALLDYKVEYERASRTLGAVPFVAFRTVTSPIIKPSLIAAFVLSFARSLSETGATFIVAGLFQNGPVFLQNLKNSVSAGLISEATYEGATVFTSLILIVASCTIFAVIWILGPRLKFPFRGVWPSAERRLSYSKATTSRNTVTLLVFFGIVLIPTLFVALPAFQAVFTPALPSALSGTGIWGSFWQSLLLSYGLGGIVTVLGLIMGMPMAILIARRKIGKTGSAIIDVLVNIPLIVPSIALGVSLGFFWKQSFPFMPELLLLIFAHLSITYPYIVKSMAAAFERVNLDMEEAARTLGAKPFTVFSSIVIPLTKYSILSGSIMVFTRSVSETGATIAVVTTLRTAPVVLVDWIRGVVSASPLEIGLGAGILVLLSFIILFILRLLTRGKGQY
ncbi:MAG TPA: ABC transporter permease subunit [Candidatus Sulfotelmatobacter sp.]|nr:ABC transporter permease subunit [Candidatus Sulfotelmatobacter sp.]